MKRALVGLILPLSLLIAACGSSSGGGSSPGGSSGGGASSSVALSTRQVAGLGTVLVNGQGRTLYVFAPDQGKKVTCTPTCQKVWPPLTISSGQKPAVSGGVQASMISSDPNPSGGSVVTYNGWPLYLYVADPTPGTANGQKLNSSGGVWYAMSPSGTVIKKAAKSNSGGTGY